MSNDLRACLTALKRRRPEAAARAAALRSRYADEAVKAMQTADMHRNAMDGWLELALAGVDWQCAEGEGYIYPLDESAAHLDKMIRAEMQADAALSRVRELDAALARHAPTEEFDAGPTVEALTQIQRGRSGDPVLRLVALGKLSADDLADAREIAGIYYHVTAQAGARTMNWPETERKTGEARRYSAADTAEWYALLQAFVYAPWCRMVKADLPLVLGLVVEGVSLEALRKRCGMRWETALERVRAALAEYRKMRRRYLRHGAGANRPVPQPAA